MTPTGRLQRIDCLVVTLCMMLKAFHPVKAFHTNERFLHHTYTEPPLNHTYTEPPLNHTYTEPPLNHTYTDPYTVIKNQTIPLHT
jgi:hypothetical protein